MNTGEFVEVQMEYKGIYLANAIVLHTDSTLFCISHLNSTLFGFCPNDDDDFP